MVSSFYKWLVCLFLGSLVFYSQPDLAIVHQSTHGASPSALRPQSFGASATNLWGPKGVGGLHPLHVSVVEINHNATDKTLEISCKIFTDDFEKALVQNYKARVDLINPPNKSAMDSLVLKYIFSHLSLRVDGKPVPLTYVGFEHESEAVYGYVEVDNIVSVKKIDITDKLMQDLFTDQINLIHVIVEGNRKSTKLDYPQTMASFEF